MDKIAVTAENQGGDFACDFSIKTRVISILGDGCYQIMRRDKNQGKKSYKSSSLNNQQYTGKSLIFVLLFLILM